MSLCLHPTDWFKQYSVNLEFNSPRDSFQLPPPSPNTHTVHYPPLVVIDAILSKTERNTGSLRQLDLTANRDTPTEWNITALCWCNTLNERITIKPQDCLRLHCYTSESVLVYLGVAGTSSANHSRMFCCPIPLCVSEATKEIPTELSWLEDTDTILA